MSAAKTTLATLAALVAMSTFAAAAPTAHAELRAGLAVGSPAQLAVTIDATSATPPKIALANADVRYAGQMSQTSIINGSTTAQLTFMYTLVPQHAGALDIPALSVSTPDGDAVTAPIHATVAPAGAAPAAAPAVDDAAPAAPSGPHAFIDLEIPSHALYVGQGVPVKIHAYFRAGTSASLEGQPKLSSDAFTFSELSDKPSQTQVELHGVPYLMATWTAILSPAKPSDGKLSVELPVELAYRDAPRRRATRSPIRDLLSADPFAGSFFGDDADPFADLDSMFDTGPVEQHAVTLKNTAGRIVVTDLPAAGKPAGFSGAVGHFALAIDPPTGELRVGEPATISIHATGTGNFDRLAIPGLTATPELDTYAGKTAFVATGANSLAGTKTFTQTIVPRHAGDLAIPAVEIAYFDPVTRTYATARTAPLALTIAPGATAEPASARVPVMAAKQIDLGDTLTPLFHRARFRGLVAVMLAAAAALMGLAWWRRDPRLARVLGSRRLDRAIAKRQRAMAAAARRGDSTAFFTSAREALQARLGAIWHIAPEAITAADVSTRLGTAGAGIHAVFEHADQTTYAADLAPTQPLDPWLAVVRDELARLEVSP
jgi:hypothetical protein